MGEPSNKNFSDREPPRNPPHRSLRIGLDELTLCVGGHQLKSCDRVGRDFLILETKLCPFDRYVDLVPTS
jgi:hypothetical protein